jgi:hypothetical protein
MKAAIHRRIAALTAAALIVLSVTGCGEDKTESVVSSSDTASQTYPVGTFERQEADKASSEEEAVGDVTDFGSKSIFKGITIETDINGEIVYTQEDGEIRYRVTDTRFKSYSAMSKFVKKKAGSKAMNQYSSYFGERNGKLCFIIGARGCEVRDFSQYYVDGSKKLNVDIIHTEESRKKYKVARSQVNFVKDSKGVWKLDSMTVFQE